MSGTAEIARKLTLVQKRLEAARTKTREVMERQHDRLEHNRRFLERIRN